MGACQSHRTFKYVSSLKMAMAFSRPKKRRILIKDCYLFPWSKNNPKMVLQIEVQHWIFLKIPPHKKYICIIKRCCSRSNFLAVGTWKDFIPDCSLGGGPTWQRETKEKNLWTSCGAAERLLLNPTIIINQMSDCWGRDTKDIKSSVSESLVSNVGVRLNESTWQTCFSSRNAIMKGRQVLIPHCWRLPPCLPVSLPGITRPLETETETAGALMTPLTVMRTSSH